VLLVVSPAATAVGPVSPASAAATSTTADLGTDGRPVSHVGHSDRAGTDSAVERADADAVISDGGTYWVGQTLYTDAFDADSTVDLRRGTPTDDSGLAGSAFGDGEVALSTDSRTAGRYYLTDGQGTTVTFRLVRQTLEVSFDDRTASNRGPDARATLSIRTDRRADSRRRRRRHTARLHGRHGAGPPPLRTPARGSRATRLSRSRPTARR
jgi:hypothetical protein